MNTVTRALFDDLHSKDSDKRGKAFVRIIEETAKPVDWAYEIWDEMLEALSGKDNRLRSIASQVLSNLAKSDPRSRMLKDFPALLAVTKDERFVTARHCLQSLWKVGVAGRLQQKKVVDGLARRFRECAAEKNCTLIRYDIIQCLRRLYDGASDEAIKQKALELIETEKDLKYRKKYETLWRVR